MLDSPESTVVNNELGPKIKEFVNKCLEYHEKFDIEWRKKGRVSYHNENHVNATLDAAQKLVDAALKDNNDPLGILNDLQIWNDNHRDAVVGQDDFIYVVRMAFAAHDLGNIAYVENGKIIYLDKYQADGAEDRSKQIAERLISQSKLTDDQKRRFLPLITHLIDQTKYFFDEGGKDKLFARFVRVVDQIGGNLFSKDYPNDQQDLSLGVLYETIYEKGESTFTPNVLFNFVVNRFPELVEDENLRNNILRIFGKSLPNKIEYNENQITIKKEALAFLHGIHPELPIMYIKTKLLKDEDYKSFIYHDFKDIINPFSILSLDNFLEHFPELYNAYISILDLLKKREIDNQKIKLLLEFIKRFFLDNPKFNEKINFPIAFTNIVFVKIANFSLFDLLIIDFLNQPTNEKLNSIKMTSIALEDISQFFRPEELQIGDRIRGRQVNAFYTVIIFNLLKNARRYSNKIILDLDENGNIFVENLSQTNLPSEDRLFQLQGKGSDKKANTGYGLFISKFLALSEGIDIIPTSNKNENGTYTIRFTIIEKSNQ